MEISNRYTKLSFAAFAAFLLVFFVISSPHAQGASVGVSQPEEIGPEHRLYKYLNHVPVTEYEWSGWAADPQHSRFSPTPTAPSTDHLLWENTVCKMHESLHERSVVVNGKIIVRTNPSKSIYDPMTYALDQNTGEIIWSYPASGGYIFNLDDTHLLVDAKTCVNTQTGDFLWEMPRSIDTYVPELKMGFGNGPNVGLTGRGRTIMAWDFSDLSNPPREAWVSEPYENAMTGLYDNGKVFVSGGDVCYISALDAKTGRELWSSQLPTTGCRVNEHCSAGYGKIYLQTWKAFYAFDQETGKFLWKGTFGHHPGHSGLAYGKVYAFETRTYLWAFDANDGHVVWRYLPVRKVPHWCGASAPGDCNHTSHHVWFYNLAIADGKVYATTMQKTTYPSLLPPNYEGYEYEGVKYWVNPNPFPVISHCGENEFVCLDAETGKVVWRVGLGWPYGPNVGTEAEPAYIGPDMTHPVIADGKVYGIEQPYSSHTGVGTSRKEVDPLARWDVSQPKWYISNEWYPGRVYCFGPGPSEMTASTDKAKVKLGEPVTISGSVTDLSPATPGTPAAEVPVVLTWSKPDGTKGEIALLKTDKAGKFSHTWAPWITGEVSIQLESDGGPSYEPPNTVIAPITVEPAMDLVPILEGALVIAVVAAVALPIVIYARKR
jgi:outer membrane protein assembly factor BamB